eukprot:TRINITY_DN5196_c0_g1_i1.p1 TRINITY_DN5196_c0_g1~~TRINITY_DN5196_c0_g1_i1.p1  ORF type:complete len:583 (+),score=148.80 TRINITY_DN5196_c0_g1_i1:29-1777(+)
MGETLGKLFVDPTTLPGGEHCGGNVTVYHEVFPDDPIYCAGSGFGFVQVLFLMCAYGYVLFFSSNLISDGSELLLLVPSLRGIVGSVVLPILGAVPDGAIVLFSGLGADAQSQVAVGVGALAGSTIMLLTLPWFLAILGGRVDIIHGRPNYRKPRGARNWSKLSIKGTAALTQTGVGLRSDIAMGGKIMLASSLIYLLIQGPAFATDISKHDSTNRQAEIEHDWALAGLIVCLLTFVGYLVYQVKYANISDQVDKATRQAIGQKLISLSGVFGVELRRASVSSVYENTPLVGAGSEDSRFRSYLKEAFTKYDLDGNGTIDSEELLLLFRDLNENITKDHLHELMDEIDTDRSGTIDFEEFAQAMTRYVANSDEMAGKRLNVQNGKESPDAVEENVDDDEGGDDEEEEEDIPEDFVHLSPEAQQRAILLRSCWMMGLGTILVLLFSDPMVDVLDDIGTRTGIKPFYIAFVLAPLASNASELIAAYNYAKKKTHKTMAISLSTLEGAAIMNNTFCLSIFLLLVYVKNLAWQFSAETISILLIQILMAYYAHRPVHRLLDGLIIFSFYPLSLLIVALLEGPGHID